MEDNMQSLQLPVEAVYLTKRFLFAGDSPKGTIIPSQLHREPLRVSRTRESDLKIEITNKFPQRFTPQDRDEPRLHTVMSRGATLSTPPRGIAFSNELLLLGLREYTLQLYDTQVLDQNGGWYDGLGDGMESSELGNCEEQNGNFETKEKIHSI
ncbi:hypothetical protein PT974_10012 [Cladobotryum mycophilum]|uniref:Uncharacterized protein n=1 Tax=Cladobotryum mycophilum TaxID=491253 RepID=A0ABR0S8P0_9HYPO